MLRLHLWISPSSSFPHPCIWIVPSNIAKNDVPSLRQSCPGVNFLIFSTSRAFLSGCIDLHLYLSHARSNDHYCCSVLGIFLLVSASILAIFEYFSSEQTILDSPTHNLWLNITAEPVLCLIFLLDIPQQYLQIFSASLEV